MPKRCFEGFLHTGRPTTLDADLGIWRLNFVNRTTYNGTDWPDGTTLPTNAWFQTVAANYTNPRNYLLLDIESWPIDTQVERIAAASKFATTYTTMKALRPDLQIGFYAYTPRRDFFRATGLSGSKAEWQAENDDMAEMYSKVDFFAPSLYFFYTRSQGGQAATNVDYTTSYAHENIVELKRCRAAYGRNQPIYSYVWYRRQDDGADLDIDAFMNICRTAYLEGDGLILWGGFQQTWNESATWWGRFKMEFPFGDRTLLKPRAVRN